MNYSNDDFMTYDINSHRYVPTAEGFNQVYGINLFDELSSNTNSSAFVHGFLYRASLILYNYIYEYAQNKDEREYTLSLQKNRQCIKEALYELIYFWLINKYDPTIMTNEKWENLVPYSVKHILEVNGLLCTSVINIDEELLSRKGIDY